MRFNLVENASNVRLERDLEEDAMVNAVPVVNLFYLMRKAERTCSSEEMENQKIGERISGIKYKNTSLGLTPVVNTSIITDISKKEYSVETSKLPFFGVYSYINGGTVHKGHGGTVHRRSLPLYSLIYKEGYGEIIGASIDDVGLESILVSDKIEMGNGTPIDTACHQIVVFDDEVIKNLKNGIHRVVIFEINENGEILSDNFTFVLED